MKYIMYKRILLLKVFATLKRLLVCAVEEAKRQWPKLFVVVLLMEQPTVHRASLALLKDQVMTKDSFINDLHANCNK